jgi:hypothetical protein
MEATRRTAVLSGCSGAIAAVEIAADAAWRREGMDSRTRY